MKRNNKTGTLQGALSAAIVLLVVCAICSCTKEPLQPSDLPDKEYIDFSMELTPPGAFTSPTKAMSDVQQNVINSAEVLVFSGNKLLYHKTGTVSDIDGVKKRMQVTLKTSQTESDLFDIMVIGNSPTGFNFDTYVNKTKDELKAAFSVSATGKFSASEFVMYGEAVQTLIKPTTNNFRIQMLRSMARVDIGVGVYNEATDSWAGLSDVFSLTEVRLVNSRDKAAVIPQATTLNETGNVKVSEPTIPSGTVVQGTTAADAILYSGSTDITTVDGQGRHTKSTIFIAEAPNTTDRVTLLVGGSYKGEATTYYRIDMCVPKAGTPGSYDYLNILRNHLYRISITGVSGVGFVDPQEALISNPINITTTLTPIEEGGSGDIVFDGNNYIMTDVSSVQIYGKPDGVKKYTITTVKANFLAGVAATITGTGITTPLNLVNGVAQTVSVALPATTKTGSYTIKVGKLTKVISLKVQAAVDAHFDFLPFQNVASITIEKPQSWITLSQNMTYVKSEQQPASVTGDAQGKAVVHFDENIATTGNPRMAEALVLRNNNPWATRVVFEQLNLSGMVLGYFGGAKGSDGYTQLLAVESMDEHAERTYDDTSIGTPKDGMQWGFLDIATNISDKELGKAGTIALAKRTDSKIPTPYTIYNNYAARYCYDKNRDIDGNGAIDDSETRWYLPAQNQLMGGWIVQSGLSTPFVAFSCWSATENGTSDSWYVYFSNGITYSNDKTYYSRVRCVREL